MTPLDLDTATRTRLRVTVWTSFDPTDATLTVLLAGQWWPTTWTTPPDRATIPAGQPGAGSLGWRRTGRTTTYFAGPDATSTPDDVVLPAGSYPAKTRVELPDGDQIAADTTPVRVA